MDDLRKAFESKFGQYIFAKEENEKERIEVVSTGSISLDASTGVGGIPLGKFTEIYGPESTGKTTIALNLAKNAVEKGYKVLYIDVEQVLDYNYISAVVGNFDMSNLLIAQPESAEDALNIAEFGLKGDRDTKIQPGDFKLIILDSVGALAPEKEKEDELEDSNVALIARIISRFLRRNAFDVRTNGVAFVFINQIRANIGSYYGGYVVPGGNALDHILCLKISLTKGPKIERGKKVVGIQSNFVIKKNKLAPPFRSHYLPIIFGKGIDYHTDLIDFAEMLGVINKRGPYYFYGEENLGQGLAKTLEFVKNNPETLDSIEKKVYNVLNVNGENGETDEKET